MEVIKTYFRNTACPEEVTIVLTIGRIRLFDFEKAPVTFEL
jgi:hypothetical protein